MFTSALKTLVAADSDESKHQAILNVAYNDWQREDNKWSYADMLKNAELKYGELAVLAILIGKYGQQVCNGGHSQYWSNGYASRYTDGFGSNHEEAALHLKLIELFNKYHLSELNHGGAVLSILEDFLNTADEDGTCFNCSGDGGWDSEEDHGEYEECIECRGSGDDTSEIGGTDHLDTRYYDVNEEWEAELETFFKSALEAE